MEEKRFQPEEIDKLIPQIEGIFQHIDECKHKAAQLTQQVSRAAPSLEIGPLQLQAEFLMDAVQDNIELIGRLGGVMKDIEEGLVDFLGEVDGHEAWLCWKRGERQIRFWHPLETGFSERQTLYRADLNTTLH